MTPEQAHDILVQHARFTGGDIPPTDPRQRRRWYEADRIHRDAIASSWDRECVICDGPRNARTGCSRGACFACHRRHCGPGSAGHRLDIAASRQLPKGRP